MNHHKKSKIIVIATTVLLASVALAGCHEDARDDEQFTIGSILPLTGDLSPFGPSAQNAVNLAVQHVNAAGGVNGQDVRHVEADSETRGEAAFSAAGHLIEVERVHAIVGAMGSGVSMRFIDRVIDAQIPMVSPSNTAPGFTDLDDNGWYFRTVPSDALQGPVMADLLLEHGVGNISIIMLNNDYGIGFGDALRDSYEQNGGNVVAFVPYDPEGTDFSGDVSSAMEPGPEAVVLIGYPDTGTVVLENAFGMGHLGGNAVPWYFSEGMQNQDFVTQFHAEAEDGILDGYWGTVPEQPEASAFASDFEAAYGSSPALFSDRTYDAAMVLMLGAEHCQCTGGRDLLDSMRAVMNSPGEEVIYDAARALELIRAGDEIMWTGAAGPMEWDDVGDIDEEYAVFATWEIQDGEIQVVRTGIRFGDLFQ